MRAKAAEKFFIGKKVETKVIREGAERAAGETSPVDDFRASAGRRLHEHQIIYISAGQGWFKSAASAW
jgi:CO/xanthine dehydrogenase FAD-binding subunit